jgi:asparagine synthetase A
VAFDNKYTPIVSQFYEDASNYMRINLNRFKTNQDVAIFTYLPIVIRDIVPGNNQSMVQQCYFIESKVIKVASDLQTQKSSMITMINMLNVINQSEEFHAYKSQKYLNTKINFITLKQLIKLYPTLSTKKALEHYVVHNGITVVHQVYTNYDLQSYPSASPSSDDYANTNVLYVFNKFINSVVPIIKISLRPNKEIIKNQLEKYLPATIIDGVYNETLLSNEYVNDSSLGIQIYFSNLMMLNLRKYHLAEIVHAPWSQDFVNYCSIHKIAIF